MAQQMAHPSDPKYILRFTMRDSGDVLEYEYETDMDAKNDMDVVFSGSPNGLWFEGTYYPMHMIEKAEIVTPDAVAKELNEE